MENLTGAWINTGNSEFFVRNDDFFIKRKDCDSVEDFRCHYDSVAIA